METGLLNFLIIAMVLCFVISLVVLIISSKLSDNVAKAAIGLHIILLLIMLFKLTIATGSSDMNKAVYFSSFICSGILAFSFVIRKKFSTYLKLYFSIFILCFPLFLLAPSRVFTMMSLGLLNIENANEILLDKNYILAREQGMVKHEGKLSTYKVIKRMGMFNKTLARNIQFNFTPDSAKVLFMDEKTEIRLRAYRMEKQLVVDSADITAKTIATRDTLLKIKND